MNKCGALMKAENFRYANYEVYGEAKIAETAQMNQRYSMESLIGVVVNIELLARYLKSFCCIMQHTINIIAEGQCSGRLSSFLPPQLKYQHLKCTASRLSIQRA